MFQTNMYTPHKKHDDFFITKNYERPAYLKFPFLFLTRGDKPESPLDTRYRFTRVLLDDDKLG